MKTTRTFNVFGRTVLVMDDGSGWRAFYPGADGKRRLATDIPIPASLTADELERYLDDLCHEWASGRHPDVVPLNG